MMSVQLSKMERNSNGFTWRRKKKREAEQVLVQGMKGAEQVTHSENGERRP
eukprot:c23717_g1_i2 orf=1-153(+)